MLRPDIVAPAGSEWKVGDSEADASQNLTFKQAVNSALRRGLSELSQPKARKPFRTKPIDMGRCRLANLDNISEVLDEVGDRGSNRT